MVEIYLINNSNNHIKKKQYGLQTKHVAQKSQQNKNVLDTTVIVTDVVVVVLVGWHTV